MFGGVGGGAVKVRRCAFCRRAVKSDFCPECGVWWSAGGLMMCFGSENRGWFGSWRKVPDGALVVLRRWSWLWSGRRRGR